MSLSAVRSGVVRVFGAVIDLIMYWKFLDADTPFATGVKDVIFTILSTFQKLNGLLEGKDSLGDIPAACGIFPPSLRAELASGAPSFLFVVSGVGEVLNCIPIAARMRRTHVGCKIVFMSYNMDDVRDLPGIRENRILIVPFPFDSRRVVSRWIGAVRPHVLIIFEDHLCTKLGPVLLETLRRELNTRILEINAFRRRKERWSRMVHLRMKFYGRRMWNAIDKVIAVSEDAKGFYVSLGVPTNKVEVVPNLKFDTSFETVPSAEEDAMRSRYRIGSADRVVVFASYHIPESERMAEICRQLRDAPGMENLKVVFAPRARFRGAAIDLLGTPTPDHVLASQASLPTVPKNPKVIILDTFGDLRKMYALADVVVMGGSFLPAMRGHNPIEAAHQAKAIISGQYTENFRDVFERFLAQNALLRVDSFDHLAGAILGLLSDDTERVELGQRARWVASESRGALQTYVDLITESALGAQRGTQVSQ